MTLLVLGRELAQTVGDQIFPRGQREFATRLPLEGDPLRLVGLSVKNDGRPADEPSTIAAAGLAVFEADQASSSMA